LATLLAALSSLLFFRLFTPPEGLVVCVFKRLTELPCPLCGMTRALSALSRGELIEAIEMHAFSPVVFLLVIGMAVGAALELDGYAPNLPWRSARFWGGLAAALGVFGMIRIAALTL
jgi:hypothetical protein